MDASLRLLFVRSTSITPYCIRTMPELSAARSADDSSEYSRRNGVKNQSITKPISLDENSGEVMVRKATGKTKIRKGQSEEEYESQLYQYFEVEKGPKRTEEGWMDKVEPLELLRDPNQHFDVKSTRQKVSNFCQRLYYRRDYQKCADLCTELIRMYQPFNKKNKITREIQELERMAENCSKALQMASLNKNVSNVHI